MDLIYKKEVSELGTERFAALRENSNEEINVTIYPNVICKINLQTRPKVDDRPLCTAAEFFEAYQKALDGFGMFLLSVRAVQSVPKENEGKVQVEFNEFGMP